MTKKTRTVLFIICFLLFLLAAPSLILYSQGYRFDFEQKKITQTGAFYCKVLPRGAEVYINGKLKDKTSFFTNALLIDNLLPKKYVIEIKKDGYHPWKKTISIAEKEVSEAKHVILFPENINLELFTKDQKEIDSLLNKLAPDNPIDIPEDLKGVNFNDFSVSPDEKKTAYYTDHEIKVLFSGDQHDLGRKAGDDIFLTRFSEKIEKVIWLDSYYLLFNAGDKIKTTEIDSRDKLNMVDLFEIKNPEIYWDENGKTLYVLSESKLYKLSGLLP